MLVSSLFAALLPIVSLAAPTNPIRIVAQLSQGNWFENIAVRSNGDLLVSETYKTRGVFAVKNPSSKHSQVQLLVSAQSLGNASAILGIAEVDTDDDVETFAVVAGKAKSQGEFEMGEFSIWTLQFRDGEDAVVTRKASPAAADSALLNGLTAVPGLPNVVLVADSTNGLVARVNLTTGEFDDTKFVYPEAMAPLPGTEFVIGVNGVKVHGSHLYWTHSFTATVYRVPIDANAYPLPGAEPEVVAEVMSVAPTIDDFALDQDGNIYIAGFGEANVVRVDAVTGEVTEVFGNPSVVTGEYLTAVALGRGMKDKNTLYATSTGTNGQTEGPKVLGIRLGKSC